MTAHTINRKGAVAETYELRWRLLKWAGRLYTTPKPLIPNNPAVLTSLLSGPLTLLHRLKGALCLKLYHMAPNVADEHYVYDPYQRKVRRIGVADRGVDASQLRAVGRQSESPSPKWRGMIPRCCTSTPFRACAA